MTAAKIANGALTNTQISNSAAIAYTKLALANSIVNGDISSSAAIAYSKLALGGSIVNADVSNGAAIAYSKLNLANSIVNGDVAAGANIAYSKLNLAGSITNNDLVSTGGSEAVNTNVIRDDAITSAKIANGTITSSDLSSTGGSEAVATANIQDSAVTSAKIANGTITDADINASAGIAFSKLASLSTGQIIVGNGGTPTAATLSGDATINASGSLTIANNAITTAKIADSQITTAKLAAGAIATIIGGASGLNMATGANSFMGMFSITNATESVVQVPVQTSGTISNFDVRISAPAGTLPNSWTFTLRKNGASTAITCAISGTTATQCGDASNTVSFASGDLLSVQIVPNSTPTASLGRFTARFSTP